MVLFETFLQNDERDATIPPCGRPCTCIIVLCFQKQAEARYSTVNNTYIALTIYLVCSHTLGTMVDESKGNGRYCYSEV